MRVLFGWTEPHAVAGHGVLLTGRSGCLLCHFSDDGLPNMRVAEWEHGDDAERASMWRSVSALRSCGECPSIQ